MRQRLVSSIINGGGENASFIFNNNNMLWPEWLNEETQNFSKLYW